MKINILNNDLCTNVQNRLKKVSVNPRFLERMQSFYILQIFSVSIKKIFIMYLEMNLQFMEQQVYI